MIYRAQDMEIDLDKITRLYPAAIVIDSGESVQMSLEWAKEKRDVVKIEYYVLIFNFDKVGEIVKNSKELKFDTEEELIAAMKDVASYFKK